MDRSTEIFLKILGQSLFTIGLAMLTTWAVTPFFTKEDEWMEKALDYQGKYEKSQDVIVEHITKLRAFSEFIWAGTILISNEGDQEYSYVLEYPGAEGKKHDPRLIHLTFRPGLTRDLLAVKKLVLGFRSCQHHTDEMALYRCRRDVMWQVKRFKADLAQKEAGKALENALQAVRRPLK